MRFPIFSRGAGARATTWPAWLDPRQGRRCFNVWNPFNPLSLLSPLNPFNPLNLWFRLAAFAQPSAAPPAWAGSAIWYQVFVERFRNGDPRNDPQPADIASDGQQAPLGWAVTPWNHDWYAREPWAREKVNDRPKLDFGQVTGLRRYGGDLLGVLDKLDYLHDELGVTALYLNPVNDAPSAHKYDARAWHHVDPNFGPDPVGDRVQMGREDPAEPMTWRWTEADRLLLRLIDQAHRKGMRVILDYSWNHTGTLCWAWLDVRRRQQQSPYAGWYAINSFDDPATTDKNEFAYQGWANLPSLPEIRKTDVPPGTRRSGFPYEGTLDAGVRKHIQAVTKRWLAPDGDTARGVDGLRLDVADQIPMGFWREYRTFVKSVKPQAYLVGEIWWEAWPTRLMNPAPYLQGDVFDGVMFYQAYRPARAFFSAVHDSISAKALVDSLQREWKRIPAAFRASQMNVNATHDAPRLLTCFENPGRYKFRANARENPDYRTGRPSDDTRRRARLYLLHQFTIPGAPAVWNGDELGMWGADDPDCRKPLWWPDQQFAAESKPEYAPGAGGKDPVAADVTHLAWYKALTKLRRENPALASADISFTETDGKLLGYRRPAPNGDLLVLLNAGRTARKVSVPGGAWQLLLSANPDQGPVELKGHTLRLPPLTGAVLRAGK